MWSALGTQMGPWSYYSSDPIIYLSNICIVLSFMYKIQNLYFWLTVLLFIKVGRHRFYTNFIEGFSRYYPENNLFLCDCVLFLLQPKKIHPYCGFPTFCVSLSYLMSGRRGGKSSFGFRYHFKSFFLNSIILAFLII